MKKITFILISTMALEMSLCAFCTGKTITVNSAGGADFTSIQPAIADAGTVNGDEIAVAPGTYHESIDFLGKAVRLYSSGGPEVTILDGFEPLLQEDFNDGNYNGWQTKDQGTAGSPSVWSAATGVMVQSSNIHSTPNTGSGSLPMLGTYALWQAGTSWTDYQITLTMKSADNDAMGVMFRYQDSNNYYRFAWLRESHSQGVGRLQLIKMQNGVVTVLSDMNDEEVVYAVNQWYTIKIIASGANMDVLIDDCLYLSAVDSTFASGSMALYCWGNAGTYFDDITVKQALPHVVQCLNGEGPGTVLEGFTITGGEPDVGYGLDNFGGGMFNYTSSPTVTHCIFSDNTANSGGGMFNYYHSNPIVTDCIFSDNAAKNGSGGGMFNYYHSSPTVTDCIFSGNAASVDGGGMYNYYNSSPTVTDCTFSGNTASVDGGGMYNWDHASPTVTDCIFSDNEAKNGNGGGIYNTNYCNAKVTHCTFYNNTAKNQGTGLYTVGPSSSTTVTHCILWDSAWNIGSEEIYNGTDGSTTVTYSNIQEGFDGPGNINSDPAFVDAGAGDFRLVWYSPCVDAGDNAAPDLPAADLAGNPRIMDGNDDGMSVVDMGAYELEPGTTQTSRGSLSVIIEPNEAVDAGAMWRIEGSAEWHNSGDVIELSPGYYKLEFSEFSDWFEPQTLEVEYDSPSPYQVQQQTLYVRVIADMNAVATAQYKPLAVFEIGQIPPRDAHVGRVMEFIASVDILGEDAVFSMTPSPAPQGTIQMDAAGGWFRYEPDPSDRAAFDVTFRAETVADIVEQTIRITPLNNNPPEQTIIGLSPLQDIPNEANLEYIIVKEEITPNYEMNGKLHEEVKSVTVQGIEITIEDKPENRVYAYNESRDIKDLTIYAKTLIIKDTLWLPQTNVTIYARDILFDDGGGSRVMIKTTPIDSRNPILNPYPLDGLNATDINLFIESYEADGGLGGRFAMNGTRGFKGGSLGQSGKMTCSLNKARPLAWLSPYAVKMVVVHAKDAYLYRHGTETHNILSENAVVLNLYRNLSQWQDLPSQWRFEFEQIQQESDLLLHRIENGLDFFGNPPDWVPALSFEVLQAVYAQEIDHAMRVMYLSHWLQNKADTAAKKWNGLKSSRQQLWNQNEQFKADYANINALIVALKARADAITARIGCA
ncbi:MAG: right-handed parallel beta-helix repeat-containing protein, partial [Anaerohalosphaeraceae bacterium]